jgi:hypothetical protein
VLERGRKLFSVAGVVFGGALLLGACGNSSHVVSDATSGTTPTSVTIAATTPRATRNPAKSTSPDSKKTGSKSTASAVSQQTLTGLDSQLGALFQSLSQAVGSVDNTQGDS